jgi:orsellinic acid C2-O-methyltransferase
VPESGRDSDVLANAGRLLEMVNSSWMPQALRTAAELGIADLLAHGPRSAADLAEATSTHAPSLHRLLRALVAIDVVSERDDGTFELTPSGRLLQADVEGTVRSWAIYQGRDVWDEWGLMLEAVRTGKSGREIATGKRGDWKPGFEPLRDDPERAAIFNKAMAELTRLNTHTLVAGYDFGRYACIADVGGGYGELIAAILAANPGSRGILFDLPHAIESARPHLEKNGVLDRCDVVSGSFFDEVPGGADLYVMKSVIHDWDDERAAEILANLRRAMGASSKLVLIERLMPERMKPGKEFHALARADMNMLVAHAAPERTEAHWRRLLDSVGFSVVGVSPITATSTAIEAVPVG